MDVPQCQCRLATSSMLHRPDATAHIRPHCQWHQRRSSNPWLSDTFSSSGYHMSPECLSTAIVAMAFDQAELPRKSTSAGLGSGAMRPERTDWIQSSEPTLIGHGPIAEMSNYEVICLAYISEHKISWLMPLESCNMFAYMWRDEYVTTLWTDRSRSWSRMHTRAGKSAGSCKAEWTLHYFLYIHCLLLVPFW